MGVRHMQGVSAQLEVLKVKGPRRHPSHCKYHDGVGKNRVCNYISGHMYKKHCTSASKCDYYVDDREKSCGSEE